jgi:hypothetical protein
VKKIILSIVVLVAALTFLSPALHSEQSQKAARTTQEDRLKKLEDRADAAEKAAAAATMEKDYITRTQKQYEAYYQRVLNTQMWTLGIMGVILIGVFVLVARFSLNMIDERTKLVTAEATVQMRNEYGRSIAKEVQKLWDSNASDIKKLKESLTAQITELEQNLKDRSDFQTQFVEALAATVDESDGDSTASFRSALRAYRSGKPKNLFETKVGAFICRHLFDSLRKKHGDAHIEHARQELADPLYNGLNEELALAALQIPWLTQLINERIPPAPVPETPAPEPAAEKRAPEPLRAVAFSESELPLDEESDSCRLITT